MRFSAITWSLAAAISAAALTCSAGELAFNLPPSQRLLEPGPGVGGPGPGVIRPGEVYRGGGAMQAGMFGPGGPAIGGPGCAPGACGPGGPGGSMCGLGAGLSQVAFLGVEGGEVAWDVTGQCLFDSTPLVMPGRQNFYQAAIYRLKLTNLPERPGIELYPTLEVAPVTPRTDAYLAHSPIPVQFTDEDLDQVLSGNFVTKVIYLPDPEFQDLALSGVDTLVSTRLDPGVDPIAEADRRGSILAIVRLGNLDLQMPGQMIAMNGGVEHAQYTEPADGGYGQYTGEPYEGQIIDGGEYDGASGAPDYGPECYGAAGGMGMGGPQGMSTAGFSPPVAPPNMISGVNGPQWGMPITGTPIGLPGPPHIPLGHQAGLTSHTMKNKTRVMMPPPVHKMKVTVKQRPGMNYPRPVNHVNVAEVNRAPLKVFGGTVPPLVPSAFHRLGAWLKSDKHGQECPEDGYCPEDCPQ